MSELDDLLHDWNFIADDPEDTRILPWAKRAYSCLQRTADAEGENARLKAAMSKLGDELRMVSVRLCNATIGEGDIERMLRKETT